MTALLRPTKELLAAAGFVVLSALITFLGLGEGSSAGPLPPVPPVEGAVELAAHEVPVMRPRLWTGPPEAKGRSPFSAASVWEEPVPAALGLPPERAEGRLVPILTIGGGRARAPRAPRLVLPAPGAEEERP